MQQYKININIRNRNLYNEDYFASKALLIRCFASGEKQVVFHRELNDDIK